MDGIGQQRARDRQHLLLAAGKLIAHVVEPFAEPRKQFEDARSVQGPGRAATSRFSRTVSEGKISRSCGTKPMPASARRKHGTPSSVLPVEHDVAGVQRGVAHHGRQQRGFADAVAADHADALAGRQRRDRCPRSRRSRHSPPRRRRSSSALAMMPPDAPARCGRPDRDRPRALAGSPRFRAACPRRTSRRSTITVTRLAKRNTTSMSCSMMSTAMCSGSRSMASRMMWLSALGTPAAGSSSSSTSGFSPIVMASSTRRWRP